MTEFFDQMMSSSDTGGRFFGVVVGEVTNNVDPAGLGRVKLQFRWMADDAESAWARIAVPSGSYFLPKVDDEVLVAFEHGSIEFPYVVGVLWNGKGKPPEPTPDARSITSRSGHVIRLLDVQESQQTESGDSPRTEPRTAERIEIVDRSGKNSVVIDTEKNTVTIVADADIVVRSGGALRLSGQSVEITSESDVTVEAKAGASVTAGTRLDLQGKRVNIN